MSRHERKGRGATRKPSSRNPRVSGSARVRHGFSPARFQWKSLRAWRQHHLESLSDSLRRLLATPGQSISTVLLLAIALALPTALWLLLESAQQVMGAASTEPRLSVFLQADAEPSAEEPLRLLLNETPWIESHERISPDQALSQLSARAGIEDLIAGLGFNPLPTTIELRVPQGVSIEQVQDLRDSMLSLPVVDEVLFDVLWLERLNGLLSLGRQLAMSLALILGFGVLLVVSNSIRLSIESRRDEIAVCKLVGATNAFVRRPFLYYGAVLALVAGLLGTLMLDLALWSLMPKVQHLARLYQSDFELVSFGFGLRCIVLVSATCCGWIGAALAVFKELHRIQPD